MAQVGISTPAIVDESPQTVQHFRARKARGRPQTSPGLELFRWVKINLKTAVRAAKFLGPRIALPSH